MLSLAGATQSLKPSAPPAGMVVPVQNTAGAQPTANVATVDPGATGTGFPQRYGSYNASGIWTGIRRFFDNTRALRASTTQRNAGHVYAIPAVRRNGVLAGDAGLMPTYGYLPSRSRFMGVLYAFTPVKEVSQTVLSQWAADPNGYTGDTPGDLQQQVQNAPPWRRAVARGDSRQSFSSGIMRGLRM